MKKILIVLLIAIPLQASAISVPWNRPAAGFVDTLYVNDVARALLYQATSTTASSIFPYASTTALSATSLCLSTDCRIAWPAAGITLSSLSGTHPIIYNSGTGNFTFGGLSTSTAAVVGNIPYFSGANTFANVATGTASGAGNITVTAGRSVLGGSLSIDGSALVPYTGASGAVDLGANTLTAGRLIVNGNASLASSGFFGFMGTTVVDSTNYSLFGNTTLTLLNARTGASIGFRIANADVANFTTTGGFAFGSTYYNVDPGQNNMTIEGRAGIATSTPAFRLDVNGRMLLEPTASSTTAYSGVVWNDSSLNKLAFNNGGNDFYIGGNLYTATGDQTINSATPTTAFSPTRIGTNVIKANTLRVGQKFSVWGSGYYSTPIGNTSTVTITTSIASSTATTISTVTTAIFPASATNLPFDFQLNCTVRSIGTAATLVCDGDFRYATALSAVAKTSNSLSTVGTIKFDSTVDETLDVKASWSAVTTQTATIQEVWIDS